MSVTNINGGAQGAYAEKAYKQAGAKQADTQAKAPENKPIDEKALDADKFEKSEKAVDKKTGYEKLQRLSKAQLDSLKTMQEDNLRNLVSQLIGGQAAKGEKNASIFSASSMQVEINIENMQVNMGGVEAQTQEDWGVDAVATRIMDMAVSLSGGDSSKISMLKGAVEQGFKEAGIAFGRELPEVCHNTYDEVMKRFDHWEKNGSLDGYVYNAAKAETGN